MTEEKRSCSRCGDKVFVPHEGVLLYPLMESYHLSCFRAKVIEDARNKYLESSKKS